MSIFGVRFAYERLVRSSKTSRLDSEDGLIDNFGRVKGEGQPGLSSLPHPSSLPPSIDALSITTRKSIAPPDYFAATSTTTTLRSAGFSARIASPVGFIFFGWDLLGRLIKASTGGVPGIHLVQVNSPNALLHSTVVLTPNGTQLPTTTTPRLSSAIGVNAHGNGIDR